MPCQPKDLRQLCLLPASATCTVTQDAGTLSYTYDVPEVTLQYNDITYNATQVLPTYSYRQHWSDNAGNEGYIEMGDADDTADVWFGKVTNSSHKSNFDLDTETGEVYNISENTSASAVTVGDITLTVEMNGMIGTATASFTQYANSEVEVFTLDNGRLFIVDNGTSLSASDINLLVTLEFWGVYDSGASGLESVISYYSDDPLTISRFNTQYDLYPSHNTYTQLPSEHITYAGVSIYDYAFTLRDKKITYSLTFHYDNNETFTRSGTIYCTGDYDVDKDEVPWTTDERDQSDANLRFDGTTDMYPELYIYISD